MDLKNNKHLLDLSHGELNKVLPKDREGDALFSYINFKRAHNREPSNLPIFNDVLFNIKISDEILNPLRVFVTDKEFSKIYIKSVVGNKLHVPTLKILRSKEEILSYAFPRDCFIKPTHGCGQFILRNDNNQIDKERILSWMSFNYYDVSREANYRYLNPKIIVEPIISNNPNDYKIFCFNGKPKLIWVDQNWTSYDHRKRNFFDLEWRELPFSLRYPRSSNPPKKPRVLKFILEIAAKLSINFSSLVRIDFYVEGDRVVVGEITNCSGAASANFDCFESELTASKIIFS